MGPLKEFDKSVILQASGCGFIFLVVIVIQLHTLKQVKSSKTVYGRGVQHEAHLSYSKPRFGKSPVINFYARL